jgi:hypothetical protein
MEMNTELMPVDAFQAWVEAQLTRIPGKSDLAKAFRYGLSRWSSCTLFLDDGGVAIDNNAAERGMRPIGVGRARHCARTMYGWCPLGKC